MQLTASIYVALSALLVLALAAQVILLRRSKRIGLGDGGD
ncbi:MAG: glutathione S-transferase, partial [Gammaproteobacteria bacterium HGW-Gammaproteobacteria-6]